MCVYVCIYKYTYVYINVYIYIYFDIYIYIISYQLFWIMIQLISRYKRYSEAQPRVI